MMDEANNNSKKNVIGPPSGRRPEAYFEISVFTERHLNKTSEKNKGSRFLETRLPLKTV
jgi:hypothetical protein